MKYSGHDFTIEINKSFEAGQLTEGAKKTLSSLTKDVYEKKLASNEFMDDEEAVLSKTIELLEREYWKKFNPNNNSANALRYYYNSIEFLLTKQWHRSR